MRAAPLVLLALAVPAVSSAELSNDTLLGAGLRTRPAYDGSASQKTEVVPVLRYLGEPLFVRSTQGVLEAGLRTELAPDLHAGAQLAYEAGRDAKDADLLSNRGIPSVGIGASLGLQLEWDHRFGPMPVTALLRGRQHTKSARGAQLDLRLSAGVFQSGPFGAGVFVQSVWADRKSAGSLYDVSPAVSLASGLPAYAAGGGWLSSSAGVLWSADLGSEWTVVGNLEWRRLRGSAVRSPLVEKTTNHAASAGLARRF